MNMVIMVFYGHTIDIFLTLLGQIFKSYYRPLSRGDNMFGSVCPSIRQVHS